MQCTLLLSIFQKHTLLLSIFHLGYKEIPDINIIGNKREYAHNCCLAGNTWGNGIYAGNQDFKIPNLFMRLNSGLYFFSFISPIALTYSPTKCLEEISHYFP